MKITSLEFFFTVWTVDILISLNNNYFEYDNRI